MNELIGILALVVVIGGLVGIVGLAVRHDGRGGLF